MTLSFRIFTMRAMYRAFLIRWYSIQLDDLKKNRAYLIAQCKDTHRMLDDQEEIIGRKLDAAKAMQ